MYWLVGWLRLAAAGRADQHPPSASPAAERDEASIWNLRGFLIAAAGFVTPILVAGLLLMAYNAARFGSSFDTGYHFDSGEGFSTPIWVGFWGLVVSPYRGVFWHTPLFLASIFTIPAFWRRHRAETLAIAVASATVDWAVQHVVDVVGGLRWGPVSWCP
ncbi:MAG: hypothetical protein HC802_04495 [Caldilineaceae bacterium]|nr:hypothetical protein [Caldilineaceae bacterium]